VNLDKCTDDFPRVSGFCNVERNEKKKRMVVFYRDGVPAVITSCYLQQVSNRVSLRTTFIYWACISIHFFFFFFFFSSSSLSAVLEAILETFTARLET
jgi:hypothetical protein